IAGFPKWLMAWGKRGRDVKEPAGGGLAGEGEILWDTPSRPPPQGGSLRNWGVGWAPCGRGSGVMASGLMWPGLGRESRVRGSGLGPAGGIQARLSARFML